MFFFLPRLWVKGVSQPAGEGGQGSESEGFFTNYGIAYPEKLTIYHAGTGSKFFLCCLHL